MYIYIYIYIYYIYIIYICVYSHVCLCIYNFCKHKTLFVKNISVAYPITKRDSALPIMDEILLQSDLIPTYNVNVPEHSTILLL